MVAMFKSMGEIGNVGGVHDPGLPVTRAIVGPRKTVENRQRQGGAYRGYHYMLLRSVWHNETHFMPRIRCLNVNGDTDQQAELYSVTWMIRKLAKHKWAKLGHF